MDPVEARLKVLRLARLYHQIDTSDATSDDEVLKTARLWGEFVVGSPVRESKTAGQGKGLDAEAAAARGEKV